MENSSFNWVIENYDLGKEIGSQAADWINEKFDNGEVEVAVLGYPQTPILLERENGILDARTTTKEEVGLLMTNLRKEGK